MSLVNNPSLGGAGEHLFFNEELSDIAIIVEWGGSTVRFPAHELILASQSTVFRLMLSSDFAEKNSGQIVMKDVKPKTVELFLEYIYCGRSNFETWNNALELLSTAHKYRVEPLVQNCAKFLENVLTINNVCYVYNKASVFSMISLKEKCLKLILDAGFLILKSKAFEMLDKENLFDIVSCASLNIDSELTVFDALLQWAPLYCVRLGKRVTEKTILQELEPFLNYVCFDDMPDTEKSQLPAAVLSCVKPNNRNRITYHVPESLLAYSYHLHFHINNEIVEIINESLTCIRFSIDRTVYLIGIKFVVIISEFPPPFQITIVRESEGSSSNPQTMIPSSASWREGLHINDRKRYEAQVLLWQPFKLKPNTVYRLYCVDRTQIAGCPKTYLIDQTILTDSGRLNISLHSESIWGVVGLIFI